MAATRLLDRTRASTIPPQELRGPQSPWSWIFFRCSARGTACPPKSRRRASEGEREYWLGIRGQLRRDSRQETALNQHLAATLE